MEAVFAVGEVGEDAGVGHADADSVGVVDFAASVKEARGGGFFGVFDIDDGKALVATVFDLFCANYGLDRGLGGSHVARDYNENVPYTPAWAEKITGRSPGQSDNSSTKTAPLARNPSTTYLLWTIS